jgi:hypothetical protein
MDTPEETIRRVNEVHTKLAAFFARCLIEIEARQMAFEFVVAERGKLDLETLGKELAELQTAMHTAAESRFLQRLATDPDLAWLGAEIQTDTVQ